MSRNRIHKDDGVAAKKHLGQHFLKDPAVSIRIAGLLSEQVAPQVLEVGPGTGALTQPLIQRFGDAVHVVEVDAESVAYLQEADWISADHIHAADLLRSTPDHLGMTGPFAVAGNFPYNISSQILFKVLDWRNQVPECVGMFQKEVADRVCSRMEAKSTASCPSCSRSTTAVNTPSPWGLAHSSPTQGPIRRHPPSPHTGRGPGHRIRDPQAGRQGGVRTTPENPAQCPSRRRV